MNGEFVDTNILIYAHAGGTGKRHQRSVELLTDIWERRAGILSTQVLAEFYAAATGKLRLTSEQAEETIRNLRPWTIHRPDHSDLLGAIRLQRAHRLAWWDAMILNSAIKTGAEILWTEDFNHGQRFGDLLIRNPFV